mmetsp:Transcript_64628/g.151483  ORF Transcript_64628/g.151483 Transcript_64628/m.151483 type:complete len:523 (-) Transcript_64628:105-1673(-)
MDQNSSEDLVEQRISNMRRCTAHLRDLTLLRGTTSAVLLNSFGHVMKSTTGGTGTVSEGENDYDKSYVVGELDIFLSHSWHACWWQKYLTLLYYFNALPATISAVAAGLMWCALQYRIGCVGVLSWRGFFPSSILFFIVLFSWHHARAFLESYRVSIFLDKVCIHQKDEERKTQGINAIGGILNKSRTLLVAWDRTYFSRLWCSFELAAFYHSKLYDSKAAGKVVLLPIILGKVISEIAACTWALELLRIHMPFNAGLRSAALLLVSLAFATRFYDFLIESNGLKAELAEFSAQNAQCFCCSNRHLNPITGEKLSCDRALVNASIAHWYGDDDVTEGLATFNELIRGRFREEVGEAVRGARMPFHFVLVASVWPAMHQLDYITMSELENNSQKRDGAAARIFQCLHIMFIIFPLMFGILMAIMRAMSHTKRFNKCAITAVFALTNCTLHWVFIQIGRLLRKGGWFCVPLVLAESFAVFLFFQDSGMKTRTDKFAKKVKDITVRHAQQIELMPLGSRPTRPSR